MNQEYEQKLAERLHQDLRQLPPLKAPATLMLRVRAAIAAHAHRPWWKRSWAHWPQTLKVLFLAVSLVLAGAFVYVGFQFSSELSLSSVAGKLAGWLSFLAPVWDLLAA